MKEVFHVQILVLFRLIIKSVNINTSPLLFLRNEQQSIVLFAI
jgi:hypothetical protein